VPTLWQKLPKKKADRLLAEGEGLDPPHWHRKMGAEGSCEVSPEEKIGTLVLGALKRMGLPVPA